MAKQKLRKMLCDIQSKECIDLMRLIETQSKTTLAAWAAAYAQSRYLPIYEKQCPGDDRLQAALCASAACAAGARKLADIKPLLKEAVQIARDAAEDPVAQAAARAISTACAAVQTPTNSLGFLFYGAAAVAYSEAGLTAPAEVYDAMALEEFRKAYQSLQKTSIPDEPKPAKITWGC